MSGPVRRVIAGDKDGVGVFTVVEDVTPRVGTTGQVYWPISGADSLVGLPTEGTAPYPLSFFPPPGGYRAHVIEFLPADGPPPEPEGVWPDSGLPTGFQRKEPGGAMHRTDSVDVVIVLSGEIGLEAEDGTEVTLRPGDVVVQNGAMHAWRRRDVACRVCFVNLGASRA